MNALMDVNSEAMLMPLDQQLGALLKNPIKDYEWFSEAFDLVDKADELANLRSIKGMLSLSVCALYMEASARLPKESQQNSSLYIMESKLMGAVKIGRTSLDVEKRASQIKVGCPDVRVVCLYEGMGWMEPLVHVEFKDFRIGGEWFAISPEAALNTIESLRIKGEQ